MRYLFLVFLLPAICQAQVRVDTVNMYGETTIRVLVSGDTVMMSVRQFDALRGVIRSFEAAANYSSEQVTLFKKALEDGKAIEEKYREMSIMSEDQVRKYRDAYLSLDELAGTQNQRLQELNNELFRKERRAVWRGVAMGGIAGVLTGVIVGIIISR